MISNPIKWPNNAKCAVAITFDMDADSLIHIENPKFGFKHVSAISMLRYGPEVAIQRILHTYREFNIRQTFFIPAWCIEAYSDVVKKIVDDGHEVAHHGYIHEAPNTLSPEKEYYFLKKSIEIIEKHTGKKPRGWRAPLYNCSDKSYDFLIKEDFLYDSSLMGDDIPYLIENKEGNIIELPIHWGMDDWPQFVHSIDLKYTMPIKSVSQGMDVFREEFDAAYQYGGMWVSVWHPFATGRLSRWGKAVELIDYMKSKRNVWFATMEDIALYVKNETDKGCYMPRRDKIPYYEKAVLPNLKDYL